MSKKLSLRTKVLQLSITDKCDSHCIYCNFWQIKRSKFLSLDDIDKLFDVINFKNIDLLCITGGEPTEHPHISDVIRFITDKTKKRVLLSSNCLNYERLEKIIHEVGDKVHTLSTSLDGDEISHDRNRGIKGAYGSVLKSLELAKEYGIEIKLAITVVKGNIDEVPKLLRQYSDSRLDVKTTSLSAAYYGNNTEKTNLNKQKHSIGECLYKYLRNYYLEHDVKNLYTFYNGLYVKHKVRPICTVGLTEFFVFPNANVYACYLKDKLTNFRTTTHEELDQLRIQFYEKYRNCTDCFARCSSSILLVLQNHYQNIANQIVARWRKGDVNPEKDFFSRIRNLNYNPYFR